MSTLHRRLLLILGFVFDPVWNWKHREVFIREWKI